MAVNWKLNEKFLAVAMLVTYSLQSLPSQNPHIFLRCITIHCFNSSVILVSLSPQIPASVYLQQHNAHTKACENLFRVRYKQRPIKEILLTSMYKYVDCVILKY
jgi:hypothetical protein